jgi:predicted DNA-binding transcriptional regulator AlpA
MQLSLSIGAPPAGAAVRPLAAPPKSAKRLTAPRETPYRVSSETDEILRTRDVVRIIKHHRCTLFRWVRAKKFPPKHQLAGLSPGWRRSDVMAWLAGEVPRG